VLEADIVKSLVGAGAQEYVGFKNEPVITSKNGLKLIVFEGPLLATTIEPSGLLRVIAPSIVFILVAGV
jgi:hypothetical protein